MCGELRCDFKMFGRITDDGLLEVKCSSSRHGAVVMHYFDPLTAELKETVSYREPASLFKKEI